MYQFRVRVPADLRTVLGSSHVKRSLRTDSRSLAIKLSRKVAAEIDAMFEAKRLSAISLCNDRVQRKDCLTPLF